MAKLIILRGPSGSGKSTVAALLHAHVHNKTALINQDFYRHTMFNNPHSQLEAARQVMFAGIVAALDNGYDVIVEGIMSMGKYQSYFDELLAHHPTENYWFYYDVSFAETLRRHTTRSKQEHFGEAEMREWFNRCSPTGYANEHTIPEAMTATQAWQEIARASGVALN